MNAYDLIGKTFTKIMKGRTPPSTRYEPSIASFICNSCERASSDGHHHFPRCPIAPPGEITPHWCDAKCPCRRLR